MKEFILLEKDDKHETYQATTSLNNTYKVNFLYGDGDVKDFLKLLVKQYYDSIE